MKTKSFILASLFISGLLFVSCSKSDDNGPDIKSPEVNKLYRRRPTEKPGGYAGLLLFMRIAMKPTTTLPLLLAAFGVSYAIRAKPPRNKCAACGCDIPRGRPGRKCAACRK